MPSRGGGSVTYIRPEARAEFERIGPTAVRRLLDGMKRQEQFGKFVIPGLGEPGHRFLASEPQAWLEERLEEDAQLRAQASLLTLGHEQRPSSWTWPKIIAVAIGTVTAAIVGLMATSYWPWR